MVPPPMNSRVTGAGAPSGDRVGGMTPAGATTGGRGAVGGRATTGGRGATGGTTRTGVARLGGPGDGPPTERSLCCPAQ
eukprot:13757300-Alexandrium_andersonii.AAC.1